MAQRVWEVVRVVMELMHLLVTLSNKRLVMAITMVGTMRLEMGMVMLEMGICCLMSTENALGPPLLLTKEEPEALKVMVEVMVAAVLVLWE
jgi:hypothetical protein